jgi:hypothetical protein
VGQYCVAGCAASSCHYSFSRTACARASTTCVYIARLMRNVIPSNATMLALPAQCLMVMRVMVAALMQYTLAQPGCFRMPATSYFVAPENMKVAPHRTQSALVASSSTSFLTSPMSRPALFCSPNATPNDAPMMPPMTAVGRCKYVDLPMK